MHAHGERQVGTSLGDIRADHRARYAWAGARIAPGAAVIDAGCGVGYGSRMLAETAGRVLGLDVSPEAIDFARAHWQTPRIEFAVQELHHLRLDEPAPFDAAVCFECLEHLAVPELFLLRLREWLAPGAALFLSSPNQDVVPWRVARNPYHFRHFNRDALDALLQSCGYRMTAIGSQDDEAVREDLGGAFLVAMAVREEAAPAWDLEQLARAIPERMASHISLMGSDLYLTKDTLRSAREQLKEANARIMQYQTEIKAIAARVDAQERRADAQERRAEAQERRVDAQERRVDAQERRVDAQERRVDARLAAIDTRQDVMRDELRRLWQHPVFRVLRRIKALFRPGSGAAPPAG